MRRRSVRPVALVRAIPLLASAFAALVIPDVSGASAVSCKDVADALEAGKPPDQVAADLNVAASYVKSCDRLSPDCRRINDALTAGKSIDEVASDMDLPVLVVRQCSQLRELGDWLERSLNAGTGPLVPRVSALLDQVPHAWQASRCHVRPGDNPGAIETDLDADGSPELIVALNVDGEVEWDADHPRVPDYWPPQSALFIITLADRKARVALTEETGNNVSLLEVVDLLGDGRREIVLSQSDQGAHTCVANVSVVVWDKTARKLREIPGAIGMASPTGFEIAGRDLIISGGLIASAGAGEQQRNRTDRYRIEDGRLRLVDRRYEPSEFAYDRLIDGIEAESWGRTDEALRALREATEPQRPVLRVTGAEEESSGAAVRAFARFRLGALLLKTDKEAARQVLAAEDGTHAGLTRTMLDATDRTSGCNAAATWVGLNRGFLSALNPAIGYANPCWGPNDVCGPVPGDRCKWRGRR